MVYEWGRFIWWLNQNSGAVQTFATAVLIGITAWYAGLTRTMTRTMQKQLAASFQPNIDLMFTKDFAGTNGLIDTFTGVLKIVNLSVFPLKLHAVHISLWFNNNLASLVQKDFPLIDLVVAPAKFAEVTYSIDTSFGPSTLPRQRLAIVVCSDLSGESQHWFGMTTNGVIEHHRGSTEFNYFRDRDRYRRHLSAIQAFLVK